MGSKRVEPDGLDKLLSLLAVILILASVCCIAVSFFKPLSRPLYEQMYGTE
ncbi:MAG: hypothetical protein KC646_02240 [Candidatus Cloacimonetes bacterium]|nr:hypothetical protein [Candidatus Cloacimonadota bacterium]